MLSLLESEDKSLNKTVKNVLSEERPKTTLFSAPILDVTEDPIPTRLSSTSSAFLAPILDMNEEKSRFKAKNIDMINSDNSLSTEKAFSARVLDMNQNGQGDFGQSTQRPFKAPVVDMNEPKGDNSGDSDHFSAKVLHITQSPQNEQNEQNEHVTSVTKGFSAKVLEMTERSTESSCY